MTARQRLPNRRPCQTTQIEHRGQPIAVTVGYDMTGEPREVFATGPREGSDMQQLLADAAVIISIALQHDIAPEALARSLGTVPAWHDGSEATEPASPLGAILQAVRRSAEVAA